MHLVTGGSGYFGEILADLIISKGEPVKIFDLNKPSIKIKNRVEFVRGDIREKSDLIKALKDVTHIHHNVAQVPLAKNKKLFFSVNYIGMQNLLECALNKNIKKIVYTSSSAVFGVPPFNPVNEEMVPKPFESYGKVKYEAELLCNKFVEQGLDISIVRPRTILGHGRLGIFSILFDWIKEGYNIPVLDDGRNIYQFIHARDLAEICWLASKQRGPNVFNAGAKNFCSMRETLEGLCHHANTGSKVKSVPRNFTESIMNLFSWLGISPLGKYHALMYGRSLFFDNEKVQKELGYQTSYSNIEAICETYDWYIKHSEMKDTDNKSLHQKKVNQKILGVIKYFL